MRWQIKWFVGTLCLPRRTMRLSRSLLQFLVFHRTTAGTVYVFKDQTGPLFLLEIAQIAASSDSGGSKAAPDSGPTPVSVVRISPSADLLAASFASGTIRVYVLQQSPRPERGTVIFTSRLHEVRCCLVPMLLSRYASFSASSACSRRRLLALHGTRHHLYYLRVMVRVLSRNLTCLSGPKVEASLLSSNLR